MTNLIPKVPGQISAVYLPNTLVLPTKSLGVSALQKPPVSLKKTSLTLFRQYTKKPAIGTIGTV